MIKLHLSDGTDYDLEVALLDMVIGREDDTLLYFGNDEEPVQVMESMDHIQGLLEWVDLSHIIWIRKRS